METHLEYKDEEAVKVYPGTAIVCFEGDTHQEVVEAVEGYITEHYPGLYPKSIVFWWYSHTSEYTPVFIVDNDWEIRLQLMKYGTIKDYPELKDVDVEDDFVRARVVFTT